ncbi:MAG TPA: flagellar assembly protein FliW [Armatimonadota bacterium]|jgi:flagellar assembly factor FliW
MIVETSRFGRVEVDPCNVIEIPRGLIGFPPEQRFILFEHKPGEPFRWLQSLDDPALALVVVDPHIFFPDYEAEISEEEARALGIDDPGEAQILTTVTVRRSMGQITTNLLGPLVISLRNGRGAQLVLDGDRYTTRHPLPMAARREEEPSLSSVA